MVSHSTPQHPTGPHNTPQDPTEPHRTPHCPQCPAVVTGGHNDQNGQSGWTPLWVGLPLPVTPPASWTLGNCPHLSSEPGTQHHVSPRPPARLAADLGAGRATPFLDPPDHAAGMGLRASRPHPAAAPAGVGHPQNILPLGEVAVRLSTPSPDSQQPRFSSVLSCYPVQPCLWPRKWAVCGHGSGGWCVVCPKCQSAAWGTGGPHPVVWARGHCPSPRGAAVHELSLQDAQDSGFGCGKPAPGPRPSEP